MRATKPHSFLFLAGLVLGLTHAPLRAVGATGTPPELDEANRQAQQAPDRKDGAAASTALAALGAGVAMMSCLQLYKTAKQIEATDPAQAAQLRAMAAQQCAQAAQNASSAAQNQQGKDTLAKYDSPTGQTPTSQDSPSDNSLPNAPSPSTDNGQQIADESSDPDPSVFNLPVGADSPTNLTAVGVAPDTISALNPIDPARVEFDEQSKGTQTSSGSALGNSLFQSGPAPSSSNSGLASLASIGADSGAATTKGRRKKSTEESSGGSESALNSESSTGGSDMSGILARFMGGGKEDDELHSNSPTAEGLNSKAAGQGGKTPNIFQYASYRVKKAREEGSLKRAGNLAKATPRGIASVKQ